MENLKAQLEDLDCQLNDLEEQKKQIKLKRNEVLRASLEAAEEHKVMSDSMANLMLDGELPTREHKALGWEVNRISWAEKMEVYRKPYYRTEEPGVWVAVRPCGEEYENKTYLGILIGDFATSLSVRHDPETGTLGVEPSFHNPMIFIPDTKTIVFGMESWWGKIDKPEDLKKISDADIENVWYVRVLKDLAGDPASE